MNSLQIVIGSGAVARYPMGGGHWTVVLQYMLGLISLRHNVIWLEIAESVGNSAADRDIVDTFFARAREFGVESQCILLMYPPGTQDRGLEPAEVHGSSLGKLKGMIKDADFVWNWACTFPSSLLSLFRRCVLVDLDPGHLQVSAKEWDLGFDRHDAFLTVGSNIGRPDCGVPTDGRVWKPFTPFVHLPMWDVTPDPGAQAPFTSITHWEWEELSLDGRVLSVSKREAYLRQVDLPARSGRPFSLAVDLIGAEDDRDLLEARGWHIAEPAEVASSPQDYREFIAGSRAEISCPKPIHAALRTGWFSDRSACYLARGRPVLIEDTGLDRALPVGAGIVSYRTPDEAVEGVRRIDAEWESQSRAAREIAEDLLDARRVLPQMIAASG